MASSTDNIYTQTDVKSVYIYENQRWNPVTGYTNRLILSMMFVIQKCSVCSLLCLTVSPPGVSLLTVTCGAMPQVWRSALKTTQKHPPPTGLGFVLLCISSKYIKNMSLQLTVNDLWLLYSCRSLYVWMLPNILQVSDWTIDYVVPGGTDREGWQYAADFPAYVKLVLVYLIK